MDETFIKVVAKAVLHFRKLDNLSQEELAHLADLDRTYISGVERGVRNISMSSLEQIVNALSISNHEFFSYISKELK